jgi:hypothetical protein
MVCAVGGAPTLAAACAPTEASIRSADVPGPQRERAKSRQTRRSPKRRASRHRRLDQARSLRPEGRPRAGLLASLGVGGFFAIKALDEGTKHERICTAMGCTSAIGVDMHGVAKAFPGARSMNVCVDNHCYLAYPIEKLLGGSARRPRQIYYEGPAIHGECSYSVRVEVKDGRGRVLLRRETRGVTLSHRYPNG